MCSWKDFFTASDQQILASLNHQRLWQIIFSVFSAGAGFLGLWQLVGGGKFGCPVIVGLENVPWSAQNYLRKLVTLSCGWNKHLLTVTGHIFFLKLIWCCAWITLRHLKEEWWNFIPQIVIDKEWKNILRILVTEKYLKNTHNETKQGVCDAPYLCVCQTAALIIFSREHQDPDVSACM